MKGYVALITVLVVIPLLLLTGVTSLYRNISYLLLSKMNYNYQKLKINEETCLEELVYMVKRDRDFTGDFSVSMDDWVCDSTITDKVGEDGVKVVEIEIYDSNDNKILVNKELNTNTNPFELSNN